ncbi:glycosyl hydrolase family 18 protein [uncultured Gelidibacter sp.]|uniref:glycosyl hydrolase family 18 protein n=1 Tax=uncultured Gelidibacter sp. TaxID=259318 RepID=UPI00261F666F|nr:glycosyl hydrolase family 18 protein [uncultured Gelidibacter sp.]
MQKTLLTRLQFVLCCLMVQTMTSQELILEGPHQKQKHEFGKIDNYSIQLNASQRTEDIIGLNTSKVTTLNKKVFGFLPYWEQSSGAHENIRYDLLTHLACFDFLVQLDASIATPQGWPWTNEINAAHAQGVKVIMTVVNFGGANGADAVVWELVTNPAKKALFFTNVKNLIETYKLDGVNIDFEGMSTAHRGAELNEFLADLTTFIHAELPGKEVSFDGPAVNWGGWDIDGLVDSVDYVVIMAYDYTSASGANSGPVAPLTHHTSWKRSVKRTIETGTYAVPTTKNPEKLIMAVPYYGQHWKTATDAPESTTVAHVKSTRYKNTVTEADSHGGFIWNSDFEYPWYKWNDGTNWNQVWTDNELSISKKFDLAIANELGGVGMWALNYDGGRPELWELIQSKFGATASVKDSDLGTIRIHPNPTADYIQISSNSPVKFSKMELFNVLGASVLKVTSDLEMINMSHLKNGIYFLEIEDERGAQGTFKILKSN